MSERSRLRLVVVQVLLLSLLATLGGRLWYLQILAGSEYTSAAADNRVREVVTPSVRGLILDDKGRPLARNESRLVVSVDRSELDKQPDRGKAILTKVAKVLGRTYTEVKARTYRCGEPGAPKPPVCWNGSPLQPIPVTDEATTAQALQIMERTEEYPGVSAGMQAVRDYPAPMGARSAHLLGYLGPATEEEVSKARAGATGGIELQPDDLVGRAGLEKQYDADLRGTAGVKRLLVNRNNEVTGTASETSPVPGNYLVTTFDAQVQSAAEKALAGAITAARTTGDPNKGGKTNKADSGAVVVMDVRTGGIVAAASWPDYDPNVWTTPISQKYYDQNLGERANYPLLFRVTQGTYAPASTFKVVTLPAAVQDGYSLDGSYDCSSSYRVGNALKQNYESKGYGMMKLDRAIAVSCDTIFYQFADQMWRKHGGARVNAKDPMVAMARAYGLGRRTGIDLPGERSGNIVDRKVKYEQWVKHKDEWCRRGKTGYPEVKDRARAAYLQQIAKDNCTDGKTYFPGDAANFAIGQGGTAVTPLQMARIYAAIANGGTLYEPHVAKAVVTPTGKLVRTIKPKVVGKLPVRPDVMTYLRNALHRVTVDGTGRGAFAGFPLPAAAKTGTGEVYGKDTTSWFSSYVPSDKPQYAIVMMVSQGGTGSGISGPAVRKIYDALYGVQNGKIVPAKAALPAPLALTNLPRIDPFGQVHSPRGVLAGADTAPAAVPPDTPAGRTGRSTRRTVAGGAPPGPPGGAGGAL